MKQAFLILGILSTVLTMASSVGCGSDDKPTPQQQEELRQQQIERAKRMHKEA